MLRVARAALEGLADGERELAALGGGALAVVPKPVVEVDGAGLVESGTLVALELTAAEVLADLDVGSVLPATVSDWVADTAPMEKEALVAYTVLMSEISTNVMV